MKKKYFWFLASNLLKKKTPYFLGVFCLIFLFAFIYLAPYVSNVPPAYIWTNTFFNVQPSILFPVAIYSPVLVIHIFKNFRDDGTELIIISKPMTRASMIWNKAFVYLLFSIIFSLIAAISSLGIYFFDQPINVSTDMVLAVFYLHLLCFLLYGCFAIFVSVWLNNVWMILSSIIMNLIFSVYFIIVSLTPAIKTPLEEFQSDARHIVHSVKYAKQDKSFANYGLFLNTSFDPSKNEDYQEMTVEWAKQQWKQFKDQDKNKKAQFFNIHNHFHEMSNINNLLTYREQYCINSFGSDKNYSFDVQDPINESYHLTKILNDNFNQTPISFISVDGFLPALDLDFGKDTYTPEQFWNYLAFQALSFDKFILSSVNQTINNLGYDSAIKGDIDGLTEPFLNPNWFINLKSGETLWSEHYGFDDKIANISDHDKKFFKEILMHNDGTPLKLLSKNSGDDKTYLVNKGLLMYGLNEPDGPFKFFAADNRYNLIINKDSTYFQLPIEHSSEKLSIKKFTHLIRLMLLSSIEIDGQKYQLDINNNYDLMYKFAQFKLYTILLAIGEEESESNLNLQKNINQYQSFKTNHWQKFLPTESPYDHSLIPNETWNKDMRPYLTNMPLLPFEFVYDQVSDSYKIYPNKYFSDSRKLSLNNLLKNFTFNTERKGFDGDVKRRTDFKTSFTKYINLISTSKLPNLFHYSAAFSFNAYPNINGLQLILIWYALALFGFFVVMNIYYRIDFK